MPKVSVNIPLIMLEQIRAFSIYIYIYIHTSSSSNILVIFPALREIIGVSTSMRRNDRQASGYNEDLSWRERLLAAFRDRERVRSRRPKIDWLREVEGERRKKEKGRKRKKKERKRRGRDREWERRSGCAGCVNYLHTVCIYPEIYKRAARVWFTRPCARSPGETAKRVLPGEICNRMRLRLHPPESSTSGLAPALLFFLEGIVSSSSFLNQLSFNFRTKLFFQK